MPDGLVKAGGEEVLQVEETVLAGETGRSSQKKKAFPHLVFSLASL